MSDTLIVSSDHLPGARPNGYVVATPLEAIARLERRRVSTVVLAGTFARDRELASFLRAFYPAIRVEREI